MVIRRVLFVFASLALASTAFAYPGGHAGGGGASACATCHGTSGLNVAFDPAAVTSLYPGQSQTYTIVITRTGGGTSSAKVGLNVAASAGAFSGLTAPLTTSGGQIIHNASLAALPTLGGGSVNYQFTYTLPTTAVPGGPAYTLNAASAAPGAGFGYAGTVNITAIRPANPTSISAGGATAGSIDLSWAGSGPSYRVLRKTASAPTSPTDGTVVYDGSGTSATASGLAAGTTYYFAVYGAATHSATTTYSASSATTNAATTQAAATTWYVNVTTGADTNNGTTPASAFKTVTKAMSVAAAGETINVAAGAYTEDTGETYPIVLTSGVKLVGAGAASTTLDATGSYQRVIHCITANTATVVEGFTITGGVNYGLAAGFSAAEGGGIYCSYDCDATFRRNIIRGNQALGYVGTAGTSATAGGSAYGGGLFSLGGHPRIENNIFLMNTARGGDGADYLGVAGVGGNGGTAFGGGLYAAGSTGVQIFNNTFVSNTSRGGEGGVATVGGYNGGNGGNAWGGGFQSYSNTLVNNIVTNNSSIAGAAGNGASAGVAGTADDGGASTGASTFDVSNNNLFFSNSPNHGDTGTSAVVADPQFINLAGGDFHIAPTSPARGAGSPTGAPAKDFDGVTRPSPPSIGAFEPSASRLELHGDFNGDGRDDILLVDQFAMSAIWLMNGATITSGASPGSIDIFKVVGIGDLNGDGRSDIVLQDPAGGNVGCWIMNGTTITSGHLIGSPGAYAVSGVADFNGDGRADILLRDSMGNLGLWLMNGHVITGGGFVGSPGAYTVAAVADFNADTRADILLRDSLGNLGMWLMNGATIASGGFVGSPGAYSVVAAADLENNGRADIVLRDSLGNIGVWFMNGFTITSGAFIGSPGGYSVNSAGDYNGDNRADLLLRESATGAIGMWFMNGSAITGGAFVASPGSNYTVY